MKTYKLTKWGAKRLVHYYEDICDWGCSYYDEDKYTPILQDVLYHTMKTGELIIPEKYPEIQNILEMDMRSGLEMDEMDVDEINSGTNLQVRSNSRNSFTFFDESAKHGKYLIVGIFMGYSSL